MPKYTYSYFNVRGRGEIPRLVMAAGGIPFEDTRHELADWPGSIKEKMPYGQLPVLEIDGTLYPESMSISRYLADQCNLAGKTPTERLTADFICEQTRTAKEGAYKFLFEKDETKKAELKKTFEEDTRPKFLGYWEELVKKNTAGGGYLVGSQVTIADLAVLDVLDYILQDEAFQPTFAKSFPNLDKNYSTVRALPNVKKYLESRPPTPF